MASYTAPTLHVTGDDLAVTDYNSVASNTTFLYQTPYGAIYATGISGIVTNTAQQVNLAGTTALGYGFSLSSNNLVVPLTGVYSVVGSVAMASTSAGGKCSAGVYHNGSSTLSGSSTPFDSSVNAVSITGGVILCSAGDTLGLWVYQTSGAGLDTVAGASLTYLHATFVGSQ